MNKNVTIKKAAKIVLAVILAAVLLINLLTIVFSSLSLRKHLNWMPCALLSVSSGSMEPAISAGDLILVYETPYDELKIGDYVTYLDAEGDFTTHELISRGENSFETKGLANDKADDTISRGAYCAKVVAVFPGMGALLNFFTRPVPAIISILIVLFVFYGIPAVKKRKKPAAAEGGSAVSGEESEKGSKPALSGRLRNLAALALASVFACTPFMTAARYVSDINDFAPVQAARVNFKSNYMSQIDVSTSGAVSGGNTYDLGGWDGDEYTMFIEINNYSNPLLYNTIDVPYILYLELIDDGTETCISTGKYSITLNDTAITRYLPSTPGTGKIYDITAKDYHRNIPGNIWSESGIQGPYLLEKSEGGVINSDTFKFTMKLNTGISIAEKGTARSEGNVIRGDHVHFKIMACTDYMKQFYHELKGEFKIAIADENNFLVTSVSDSASATSTNSILSANIRTKLVGTGAEQTVYIYWDATKMYLDELDPTGANAISNYRNSYYDGKSEPQKLDQKLGIGYLKIPMQAKSNYTFQYIKENEYVKTSLVDYISIGTTEITDYTNLFQTNLAD